MISVRRLILIRIVLMTHVAHGAARLIAEDHPYVGQTVTVVSDDATLTFENGDTREIDLGESFKAESSKGDQLWIKSRNAYINPDHVVPYNDAIEFVTQLIQRYGKSDLYDMRGRIWAKRSAHDRAIEDYTEAIRLDSQNYAAYVNRGIAWEEQCEWKKAIADYTESLRIRPDYLAAIVDRGVVYCKTGHYAKGIADYDAAVRLAPNHAVLFNNRGHARFETGEYEKALADLNEGIRIDPNYSSCYHNRADVRFRQGKIDQAIEDAKTAIRLNPKDVRPHTILAQILFAKGDEEQALAELKASIWLDPPAGHSAMAWLCATAPKDNLRDAAQAVSHSTDACKLTKWKNDVYIVTLSAALAESGKYDDATKRLQQAIDLNPENYQATRSLMMSSFSSGKPFRDASWFLHRAH